MFLLVQVLILLWSWNSANVFILQVMKWRWRGFSGSAFFFFFNLSYQPDYCYFVCQNSLRGSREIQIVDLASLWERYSDTQTYIHGDIYANPYPLLSWDKYCGNEGSWTGVWLLELTALLFHSHESPWAIFLKSLTLILLSIKWG